MSPSERIREVFYSEIEDKWGFTREEIIATLAEGGEKFSPDKIPEYRLRLQSKYLKRLEIERSISRKPAEFVPCPICGARTYGEPSLFGRYTRTPGWTCEKGGVKHFIWWKANKIREQQGLPPIDFEAIDWSQVKLASEMET